MLFNTMAAIAALTVAHPAPVTVTTQATEAPERIDLGNGIYALLGNGGNIAFSTGADGTFVIDDQFADSVPQNVKAIRDVAETAIVFVLNTHHHGDHTGGNAALAQLGATVLSHDNVRKRLEADDTFDLTGLPVLTFSDSTTFHWNGREIYIFHLPNAHTDGDALIHFRNANVIHTGDTMFSGRYPFIDLANGGSVDGAIAALQAVYDLADEDTKIVPGHGPISSKADVLTTIKMIKEARALVRTEMMKGLDRDAIIAAAPLAALDEAYSWSFINGEKFTATLFDDLMAVDAEALEAVEAGPKVTEGEDETAPVPPTPPVTPEPAQAEDAPAATPDPTDEPADTEETTTDEDEPETVDL